MLDQGPHARVTEELRRAFQAQDLGALEHWLELVPAPRPARQQVVREVLDRDGENVDFVRWALDLSWGAALPLLVRAGARLDRGPAIEPDGGNTRWFSAINGLLDIASHEAGQWRSSPPAAPGQRGQRATGRARVPDVRCPDEDPLVVLLKDLCAAGARVNVRNDQGSTPLGLVVNGTGWWASDRSVLPQRHGITWLPNDRPSVPGAVDDANHLDGPSGSVGEALLRVLLRAGANPNLGDKAGNAVLHDMAMLTTTFRPFVWVLQAGADPTQASSTGNTPVGVADQVGKPMLRAAMAEVEKRTLRASLDGVATADPARPDNGTRRRL